MSSDPRIFSVFRTAARGMQAQRIALGAASENVANATTTRTANGTPYAIKHAVHEALGGRDLRFSHLLNRVRGEMQTSDPRHLGGASLHRHLPEQELGPQTQIAEEVRERLEYDPSHPHANADGYVAYPDVNIVEEMARMMSANRIYEANLSTVRAAKEMIKRTLEI